MIIDRGENQPRSTSDRPIIYSSATLTLCGSPPASPDPFRSPLRQGLEHSSQRPPTASTTTPTPPAVLLSPRKHAHAQTPLPPGKSPGVHKHLTTSLENMELAKIKDLEARIEELTKASSTATATAEKNAASEAEWRSKALYAEAKLAQNTMVEVEEVNSQRTKLVEELKSETALWRRKFDELLEEHSALQSRLESTTAQVSLLDKALSTVRGDTADAVAALATAEALIIRKTEEFEAYKKQKEALISEAVQARAAASEIVEEKEKKIEDLTFQNQKLSGEVDSLKRQVVSLTATVDVFEKRRNTEKAATEQSAAVHEGNDFAGTTAACGERQLLKERDSNSSKVGNYRNQKAIKENIAVYPSAPSIEQNANLPPATSQLPSPPQPPPAARPLALQRQDPPASHFDAAKALTARTSELEDSLMTFNIERSALETEIAKFPNGTAGRTVAERKRKKEIEQRVEVLNKEISAVRFELRKLGIR